jgi:hypothetical protein
LEAFLDAGTPPVDEGFGSMPMYTSKDAAQAAIEAIRAQGRHSTTGCRQTSASARTRRAAVICVTTVAFLVMFVGRGALKTVGHRCNRVPLGTVSVAFQGLLQGWICRESS